MKIGDVFIVKDPRGLNFIAGSTTRNPSGTEHIRPREGQKIIYLESAPDQRTWWWVNGQRAYELAKPGAPIWDTALEYDRSILPNEKPCPMCGSNQVGQGFSQAWFPKPAELHEFCYERPCPYYIRIPLPIKGDPFWNLI